MPEIKKDDQIILPPRRPWEKGVNPKYSCFSIEVQVLQTQEGHVFASHHLPTPIDEETCKSLPNHGLEQISFGLLIEALRRETYISVLMELSKDPHYIERYISEDISKKIEMEVSLANKINEISAKNIKKMSVPTAKEILLMLSEGIESLK